MPFGEQVFDFIVGQGASRFQPEHGQSALRVVAAYHLAVEPHPARATLGTRAAGVTAAEELVARDQFGGYLTCVRLYLLAEGVVGQFPALDTRQLLFPFARHGNIGDAHRLDDGIEGKSFFGGNKRLLAAFHVTALEKRFDDGGACGGSTDATVLHRLPQCVVLNFLARRFHCREQGGFGMQRLGFGLSFGNGRAFRCQRVAFLPAGDGNFLFFLAIDGTPSGLLHDAAFYGKLHSGTFRRDSGHILDAFLRECLDHAPGNHLIDGIVLFGEEERFLTRDEQGMVVCHLAVVHAAACRGGFCPHLVFPFGLCADESEQFGNFGKHVFGDVAASRSRIGYQLLFVEFLRDFKRLFRREAVLGVGFFLERGKQTFAGTGNKFYLCKELNIRHMRGVIYSRVSTIDQDYSKQTNELKDFAKKNNIDIVHIFEEKESGFNNDRPEFKKVQQLTKDDVDILLVWELSRLSRRSIYIQQQVKDFADKGICIYTKKENLYTLNEDGTENKSAMLLIGFTSIIAEQEVATLKERTISSKRNRIIKEGYSYTYNAPYGYIYDKETKKLSINPIEAEVIKRIFELSANGYSAYRIPVLLNADGIPTKTGKKWTLPTIATILTNTVYKGEAHYKLKGEKPKEGKRYSKTTEYAVVETPAIVTSELFDLSRKMMKERLSRSKSSGVKYNPLLRGLIVCPYCNVKYIFNRRDNLYSCHERYEKATNKTIQCFSKSISINKIDEIIWNLVKILFSKELAAGKTDEQIEPINRELESYRLQVVNLEHKQNELTQKANIIANAAIDIKIQFPNLPDLYLNKLKEVESINKEAGKYLNEIKHLEKLMESCRNKIQAINTLSDESIVVESIIDETEKYDLVHKVIDNIIIYGEGHYTLVVVTFQTGQVAYIGYYSFKRYKYYTIFYPSQSVWFDTEKRLGYITTMKDPKSLELSLETVTKEYSITDFINMFDTPENRHYYENH